MTTAAYGSRLALRLAGTTREIARPYKLICFARKRDVMHRSATNWHDGQITKNLSSPFCKNIPLNLAPKSLA
jgi:hypothetical protein